MSIIIFSRPIHSGKTTELLQWCDRKKNIHGILMPDINGSRKIFDLNTRLVFDIECTDAENTNEPLTSVGRFHFYTKSFNRANSILLDALMQSPDWLIIDEAGKLELKGKGFYTAIEKAADVYSNKKNTGNLLITVRDSLYEEVIRFFKLKNCRVIHSIEELDS
jgi:nucleoside-triphosphatase